MSPLPLYSSPHKVGIVRLGRCNQAYCVCPFGEYSGPLDGNLMVKACSKCAHTLTSHENVPSLAVGTRAVERARQTTLSILNEPDLTRLCDRSSLVGHLVDRLDKCAVIHIRAPPASGKTVLALLLSIRLERLKRSFVSIERWSPREDENYRSYMTRLALEKGIPYFDSLELEYQDITFIIDGAQATYSSHDVWLRLIKSISLATGGLKMVFLSHYGSPTSGPLIYPENSTPVYFESHQRIGILPSSSDREQGLPGLGLYFSKEEARDVIKRVFPAIQLTASALNSIIAYTAGHPVAVRSVMVYLQTKYQKELVLNSEMCLTAEAVEDGLTNDDELFNALEHSPVRRSFPRKPSAAAIETLKQCVSRKTIPLDLQDAGSKECLCRGWLYSKPVDREGITNVCVFPSNMHYRFVERTYCGAARRLLQRNSTS